MHVRYVEQVCILVLFLYFNLSILKFYTDLKRLYVRIIILFVFFFQGIKIQSSSKILNGPPYESSDKHDTRSTNASIAESASALLMIPYMELATATHNWNSDNILGKGGFGVVYKGNFFQKNISNYPIMAKKY